MYFAACCASVKCPGCGFGASSMISNGASKKRVSRHFASAGILPLHFHCRNVAGLKPSAKAEFSNSARVKVSMKTSQKRAVTPRCDTSHCAGTQAGQEHCIKVCAATPGYDLLAPMIIR